MDKPQMGAHVAVFNGHVNDANKRARAALSEMGMQAWLDEVEQVEEAEGGIMAIFNHPPTPASAAYIVLVTLFVNEKTGAGLHPQSIPE